MKLFLDAFLKKSFLLLLITTCSLHAVWYKPSTWQWIKEWRWSTIDYIGRFFFKDTQGNNISFSDLTIDQEQKNSLSQKALSQELKNDLIQKNQLPLSAILQKNNTSNTLDTKSKTSIENSIQTKHSSFEINSQLGKEKTKTIILPIPQQTTRRIFSFFPKAPSKLKLLYAPFMSNDAHVLGKLHHSVSFAIRYLDGYMYDAGACSLLLAASSLNSPYLFSFKVPLESSEEMLLAHGLHVSLFDELIAPFLSLEFFHGRIALSNEMFAQAMQKQAHKKGRTQGFYNATMAHVKYFMMQLNQRLIFKKDLRLQKLFYAFITTSLIAQTFDVINSKEYGEQIKRNQKEIAEYYRELFLNRIKELVSQDVKNTTHKL